jgi:hypothetical protein
MEQAKIPVTNMVPPGLLFILLRTVILGSKQKMGDVTCKMHLSRGYK